MTWRCYGVRIVIRHHPLYHPRIVTLELAVCCERSLPQPKAFQVILALVGSVRTLARRESKLECGLCSFFIYFRFSFTQVPNKNIHNKCDNTIQLSMPALLLWFPPDWQSWPETWNPSDLHPSVCGAHYLCH